MLLAARTAVALAAFLATPDSSPAAAAVSVATCDGSTLTLAPEEKRALDLHNGTRQARGLAPLCVSAVLTRAARAHSADMLARTYFSHDSRDGTPSAVRLTNAGYVGWRGVAENIAFGSGPLGAPDAIYDGWLRSHGHFTNIVNGALREIGIGVATGSYEGYANVRMYTVDFGVR